ncbi:MAG: hypothetical protein V1835_00160 [Candidatus Micrarchaeota archaeon]
MYLTDSILNADFLYPFAFLTLAIWAILKMLFDYDNWGQSMVLAFLAMVFLPAFMVSLSVGSAFFMMLILGALALSYFYNWTLSGSILVVLIALYAASIVLPIF